MARREHVSETPATRLLRDNKVAFGEHVYPYVEHGGAQHSAQVLGVEVKGDRHGRRGNFFFELVSNLEKDTPGCFLYSTADLLVYVFLDKQEVHALPMKDVRAWFLPRAKQYPLKSTKTKTGHVVYTTVGAIVPVKEVLAQFPRRPR